MRKLILILNLLIIPGINLFAQEKVILEQAEHAEYLKLAGEEIITLWGGVKLNSGKMNLTADWLQLNLTQEELLARGKVILVSEQGNRIEGKEIKCNLKTKQGEIKTPYISIPPYHCRGDKAYFESGTITFSNASLTTCDLVKPHYAIISNKIIIYPNDKITAKNVFFKVGKIPLFYIPFYSKSLKQSKMRTTLNLGKSGIKGTSLGITCDYFFSQKSIASLHLNSLEGQRIGKGIEYKYWKDSVSNGKSYFYYLNERKKRDDVKETKRWEISNKYFQRFKNSTGILQLELLSDKNVTRDYPQEGRCSAATWELKNYLALTKTNPNNTIRLVGERIDQWDNKVEDFEKETTYLPKLTFQTKWAKRNNIYSDLKVELTNQLGSVSNTSYLQGDVDIGLLRKANFWGKRIIFSPKIGLAGTFKEKEKTVGWLNTSLNLRNRLGRYLEIDLNHNLKKKFRTDEYHGIETNLLTSTLNMWMSKRRCGKVSTGFNLRQYQDEPLKINKDRLLPLVTDVDLVLSDNFITSLKTTYNFKSSKIEELETYFDFKKGNWQYGGSGLYSVDYSEGARKILDVSNYVTFTIPSQVRLQFHLYYDVKNHRIKEDGLTIEKDLHCWNSKFSIRHGKDTEFWINLNLK